MGLGSYELLEPYLPEPVRNLLRYATDMRPDYGDYDLMIKKYIARRLLQTYSRPDVQSRSHIKENLEKELLYIDFFIFPAFDQSEALSIYLGCTEIKNHRLDLKTTDRNFKTEMRRASMIGLREVIQGALQCTQIPYLLNDDLEPMKFIFHHTQDRYAR